MLEKGGLDMAEYSIPSENAKIGFHEIAEYIIYPGIQAPAWAFETVMLNETWDNLPDDIKVKMELAAELTLHRSLSGMIMADLKSVDELRGGGNKFVRLEQSFIEEAREKSRAWAMKASADDELASRVAKSIFDFQDFWRANSGYLVYDYVPGIQPK